LAISNVYLAESIIATIEIKSSLTGGRNGALREALDNCKSVKEQIIHTNKTTVYKNLVEAGKLPEGDSHLYTKLIPPTYIFGFKGYKSDLDSLKNAVLFCFKRKWKTGRPMIV